MCYGMECNYECPITGECSIYEKLCTDKKPNDAMCNENYIEEKEDNETEIRC